MPYLVIERGRPPALAMSARRAHEECARRYLRVRSERGPLYANWWWESELECVSLADALLGAAKVAGVIALAWLASLLFWAAL